MDFKQVITILLNIWTLEPAFGARVLGIFSVPSISHSIVYREVTKELAKRGHEVTVMTTNIDNDPTVPPEKYVQINVHEPSYEMFRVNYSFAHTKQKSEVRDKESPGLQKIFQQIFDAQLSTPQAQVLFEPDQHFDLVLVECYVLSAFALAYKFDAPSIGICSACPMLSSYLALGNPKHPFYYPELSITEHKRLSYFEKANAVYEYYKYHLKIHEGEDDTAKKHFGSVIPSVEEMEGNMSMLFVNMQPALAGVRPVVPGVVFIGGVHMKPKKPLPEDLQNYLNESPQGVIYMSLGSNILSKDLNGDIIQVFKDVFKDMPYNILWKFEEDDMPGKSSNIRTGKWFPQQDLLGHPNIKAFITQGGQQSLDEAIRDAVPLVVLPFFADQYMNAQRVALHEIGINLNIENLTYTSLGRAIKHVITDKKYKKNLICMRKHLHDQAMSPLERAVWWAEYVIRHKGTRHLRSPSTEHYPYPFLIVDCCLYSLTILPILGMLMIVFLCSKIFSSAIKIKQSKKSSNGYRD